MGSGDVRGGGEKVWRGERWGMGEWGWEWTGERWGGGQTVE